MRQYKNTEYILKPDVFLVQLSGISIKFELKWYSAGTQRGFPVKLRNFT